MEFSPRAAVFGKRLYTFSLITITYLFLVFLEKEVPGGFFFKNIVASSGGGAALYFLFCAQSYLSRVATLYTLVMSSSVLFIFKNALETDIAILILLTLSTSFYVALFFHSSKNLERCFIIIFIGFLTLIGLGWAIAFLVELNVLFCVLFLRNQNIKKKEVMLSFSILLLICLYLYLLEVQPGFRIGVVLLFGAAGAGGLLFLCLNKTDWEQGFGFFLYVFMNLLLGVFLKKEDGLFPNITFLFLVGLCIGFVFMYLVSRIKEESLPKVITESKPLLRGVFFPFLYILDERFFCGEYFLWISSFAIHVLGLLLFKFILQNEDQDPILENEEKG